MVQRNENPNGFFPTFGRRWQWSYWMNLFLHQCFSTIYSESNNPNFDFLILRFLLFLFISLMYLALSSLWFKMWIGYCGYERHGMPRKAWIQHLNFIWKRGFPKDENTKVDSSPFIWFNPQYLAFYTWTNTLVQHFLFSSIGLILILLTNFLITKFDKMANVL